MRPPNSNPSAPVVTTTSEQRGILSWVVEHPVAANLFMFVLVLAGVIQFSSVTQEIFPAIDLDSVIVRVVYRGATPVEVVDGVVLAVEEAVRGVEDVDEISSSAQEGVALISAKIEDGADPDTALRDVKNAVDAITSFPADVERPVVYIPTDRNKAMTLIVYGEVERQTLRALVEDLRVGLLDSDSISLITESGLPAPEISIEVPLAASRQYGLTLGDIARRVGQASVDISAGEVEAASGETLFRIQEERRDRRGYEDVVLRVSADGGTLRVGDIATVIDGFRDTDEQATYDGVPAASLRIYPVRGQKPLDVSRQARAAIEAVTASWPASVNVAIVRDETEDFRERIEMMLENGTLGLLLVLIVLAYFSTPVSRSGLRWVFPSPFSVVLRSCPGSAYRSIRFRYSALFSRWESWWMTRSSSVSRCLRNGNAVALRLRLRWAARAWC